MAYTDSVSPKKVQEAAHRGFKRMSAFRSARLMFLRNYVGQYYDGKKGEVGTEALNLIFNAIRVLIPNIVMAYPKHTIETRFLQAKSYCELMGLALDQHDKQINITDVYRRVITDAVFTMGIMKTGLASSDTVYALNDTDSIDTGTVYTDAIDFDNFIVDPNSKEHLFRDARFLGDRICVPRRILMESGNYNTDLIAKLPSAYSDNKDRAYDLSMKQIQSGDNGSLEDEVEVIELWVPSANAIVTIPGDEDVAYDDYLRVDDYYGVREGPYTLLALTPPVPGNPMPVPSVGVWNDLHILANRMAKKIVDQAERQKDIIGYKRASADDAEELRNAKDGDTIAMDDPDGVRLHKFGGQEVSNEQHLQQLQGWFNMMAGNPQQLGGSNQSTDSATGAMILQQNASIGLEDMKDLVYQSAAAEARKRAWFFHTDPMMNVPITKRQAQPAQYAQGPTGPIMIQPPMLKDVQVILTPEARKGEFIDYIFTIEAESMGRQDSKTRYAQGLDFCVKVMPAVFTAAQAAMAMGMPFSPKAMLIRLAKDAGMSWFEEVFYDPEFQMAMAQQMMAGPQAAPSKGVPNAGAGGGGMMDQIMQNGQPASVATGGESPVTQARQQAQEGANQAQREVASY